MFLFVVSRDTLLIPQETWRRLSMPTQALVKTELLKGLEAEQHEATRDYICDTVAELGAQLIEESGIGR
jgi:hypothetical protein